MAGFGVATVLLAAVTLRGLGATRERTVGALALIAAFPLLLGSVVLTRFDLYPAALVAAALAALVHRRDRLGLGLLGAAVAVKLYPAVLVPVALAYVWRRRGRREALICLGICAGVVVLAFLPFLVVAPDGVAHSIGRQLSRPLQIESLGSALYLAAHHLFGLDVEMRSGHGSQNLHATGTAVTAVLLSLAQIAVLAWIWLRRPAGAEELVRWSAAALVAFVALGKVLSPQFLIWLVPVVPLVAGRRGLRASVLLALALVLTQLWFPSRYWELARELDPTAVDARADPRPRPRRPARRPRQRSTRTASIAVARPDSSQSISAPSIRTPPSATSKRTGIPVRIRWIARFALTPITESCGPVMPTSVSAAVPPRWTRASEVCTCVCVPSTAVTFPSSQCASATFSLVASAWTSTTITCACPRACSTSSSTRSNIETAGDMKSEPSRLITATGVPSAASRTARPRPGVRAEKLAGRITCSDDCR